MINIDELNALPYPDKIYAIGLKIIGPFTASNKHHQLECGTCGHQWSATPLAKITAYKKYKNPGCPVCTHEKRYGHHAKANKQNIEDKGFEILSTDVIKQTTTDKIIVRNTKCGHTFETTAGNILHRDIECPVCAREYLNDLNRARNKERHDKWSETANDWELYESECRSLTSKTFKEHSTSINPNNYFIGPTGIDGAHHVDHIISVRKGYDNQIPMELIAHKDNLQVLPWEVNVKCKCNIKFIPKIFAEWFDVSGIYQIEEILFGFGFVRDTSAPYPLCYIKDDIAVTYCKFEYYQENTTQRKQTNKSLKNFYVDKGIRSIQIYEDELKNNYELIIAKLSHLIRANDSPVICARKCEIKQILDHDSKNRFLEINHIQGADKAQISYGAYYNNILVAVMTFTQPRVFYNKHKTYKIDTWELSRFATDVNYRITGIASRLLKIFASSNTWSQIISYADRRWSEGELYYKLGFELTHINPPGYHYIVDGERRHRWNYRKDILKTWDNYDENKTEFAITSEKGIPRIWDCGTMLFSLVKK